MNNKQIKKLVGKLIFLISSLGLLINLPIALSQTIELEVIGGGYKLRGPDSISFDNIDASFVQSTNTVNFSDLTLESTIDPSENPNSEGGIIIIDENGGNEFDVTVSASTLSYTIPAGPTVTIPDTNFLIRNYDANHSSFDILDGNSLTSDFSLSDPLPNEDLDGFSAFSNGTITLFHGYGKTPSRTKIYPALKLTIPASQHPGTYTSTLTFTIA